MGRGQRVRLASTRAERVRRGRAGVWCQEEPANRGAWSHLAPRLDCLQREVHDGDACPTVVYAGRAAAASSATGRAKVHAVEQSALVVVDLAGARHRAVERSRYRTTVNRRVTTPRACLSTTT